MTRAISRESFDELKNYLGVYLQQGRPILDADWNENQDIAVAALRHRRPPRDPPRPVPSSTLTATPADLP